MDCFVCIKLTVKAQIMLDTNKVCEINKLSIHHKCDLLDHCQSEDFQISQKLPMNHPHIATPELIYLQMDAIIQVWIFSKNAKQKEINTFNLMWSFTHYCKTLKSSNFILCHILIILWLPIDQLTHCFNYAV